MVAITWLRQLATNLLPILVGFLVDRVTVMGEVLSVSDAI